jgi:hypothetical protein
MPERAPGPKSYEADVSALAPIPTARIAPTQALTFSSLIVLQKLVRVDAGPPSARVSTLR